MEAHCVFVASYATFAGCAKLNKSVCKDALARVGKSKKTNNFNFEPLFLQI
jgi:hypothetical protein